MRPDDMPTPVGKIDRYTSADEMAATLLAAETLRRLGISVTAVLGTSTNGECAVFLEASLPYQIKAVA